MNPPNHIPLPRLIFFLPLLLTSFISLSQPALSQVCQRTCGHTPLHYPFGSSPGCGDPRFQKYITCNQNQLMLNTHTGSYPITYINYANQVFYITDPSMSSCFTTQPAKGFGLDWDAPFSFHDSTIFALLGCSTTSSPMYKSNNGGNSSSYVPQCENESTPLCSALYSCQPISQLNAPISTCCVYTPVDLGPSFEMDLGKLGCGSYTAIFSFGGQEDNAESWKYGVALKYKFNVQNQYPAVCGNCENSNGVCAYTKDMSSFICNCPNGINTTNDCYFKTHWSHGFRNSLPWSKGAFWTVASLLAWFMI